MNETDALKAAFTNGLQKAAAMISCERQAYEGTLDDDNVPTEVPAVGRVETRPAPAVARVSHQKQRSSPKSPPAQAQVPH